MNVKQLEVKKLINDSEMYLKRNHYDDYVLLYVLKRNNADNVSDQYLAETSSGERDLSFYVYSDARPSIYCIEESSVNDDLFYELESNNCTIAAMTISGHFGTWEELDKTPLDEITYRTGLDYYLKYCQENNITKDLIEEVIGLEVPNILEKFKGEFEESMRNIKTAKELIEYLESFAIPVSLNEEQAQVLLDYMDGSGYMLAGDNKGRLYQMDLEEEGAEKISMDEVILLVCDWNQEFIVDSRRRLEGRGGNSESEVKEMKNRINQLKRDEDILDIIFEQTSIWKQNKEVPVRKSSR